MYLNTFTMMTKFRTEYSLLLWYKGTCAGRLGNSTTKGGPMIKSCCFIIIQDIALHCIINDKFNLLALCGNGSVTLP